MNSPTTFVSFPLLLCICILAILASSCISKTDITELRETNLSQDLEDIFEDQPVIEKPLTLQDAIEIALAYNLDMYAQRYELEAQKRFSNAQHLKMLPPLTLDGTYSNRSNRASVIALLLVPPNIPEPSPVFPQVSSLETTAQADIRGTINLLDVGLGYVRARQEKKKNLILDQQHLRARQKLIFEVAQAYWRAMAAKGVTDDVLEIIKVSEEFQGKLLAQIQERSLSELTGLQVRSRLVDQQIQLETIRYQYQTTIRELSGLMGLLPGTHFELAGIDFCSDDIIIQDLKPLEEEALSLRPEIFVKDLEQKVAIERIRESILQILPNVSLYGDEDFDGNPFLIYNYWSSVGIRAVWNLFLIPQQLQERRSAQNQEEFAKTTRLALSIAVITQVHLAYINYRDAINQHKLAMRSLKTRTRLSEVAEKIKASGEFHGIDTLDFMTAVILAKIYAWKTYSTFKAAEEQLNYAVGKPFYFGNPVQRETPGNLVDQEEDLVELNANTRIEN